MGDTTGADSVWWMLVVVESVSKAEGVINIVLTKVTESGAIEGTLSNGRSSNLTIEGRIGGTAKRFLLMVGVVGSTVQTKVIEYGATGDGFGNGKSLNSTAYLAAMEGQSTVSAGGATGSVIA